ncbi:hypothetical protein KC19_9G176200 [Ceratodon purpureus]|uniref:Uncharacterized protein n=1 Tax=Ceratodon purpureus TaxID=3225 RepID=A0A8T0GT45_CERPU|nr:hypothetical protein KC19_N022200 [Ceratodon purpureus]KAG0562851.1 hypothetical protein KC19_9G176200 [Ceratodon purpureus]
MFSICVMKALHIVEVLIELVIIEELGYMTLIYVEAGMCRFVRHLLTCFFFFLYCYACSKASRRKNPFYIQIRFSFAYPQYLLCAVATVRSVWSRSRVMHLRKL